jgi:ferrochelatase
VSDRLASLHAAGVREVVLVPIGFTSDHVEVVYDLDLVAVPGAPEGMTVRRAETVGTDPAFVAMLRDLVLEGVADPRRGACPAGCCLSRD